MNYSTVILVAIGAAVAYLLYVFNIKPRKFNDVNRIGGPDLDFIAGNMFQLKPGPAGLERTRNWVRDHPRAYRLWLGHMPSVSLVHPETARPLFSSFENVNKAWVYDMFDPWLRRGLLTARKAKHQVMRKVLTPAFHFAILKTFVEVMQKHAATFVDLLAERAANPTVQDEANGGHFDIFHDYVSDLMLDVICETSMGECVNAQTESDSEYVLAVHRVTKLFTERFFNPLIWPNVFGGYLYNFSGVKRRTDSALQVLHDYSDEVIARRKAVLRARAETNDGDDEEPGRKRTPFLDILIQARKDDGSPLSDAQIREEVDTFMFEGHDTTAAGMGWTIYLLGLHQDVQDKVYEELVAVTGDDASPSVDALPSLRYMGQVFKESHRLYPPVAYISRTLTEDMECDGVPLKAGLTVELAIYAIHHNPLVWGDDVEEFDPDRFAPENIDAIKAFQHVPFSAGARGCIGQRFAEMEEKIVLGALLKRFRIVTDASRDPEPAVDVILRPRAGVWVRLEPRTP